MSVLSTISCTSDIKKLSIEQLKTLCNELRELIISVTKENGGHLSSNLGIVETTVALHYVFDLPNDKLIFDVGHQCYAHKILSGRKEKFSSIRKTNGLSGFPDIKESETDAFSVGHAGTSISAGLGLCFSRDLQKQNHSVACVVGDGAIFNGLNLEALSATEDKPKNFLVILNDNQMAISKNNNGLYNIISKSTTKKGYIKSKKAFLRVFGNSFVTKFFSGMKNLVRRMLNKNDEYFENFGFKYVGLIDGNNIEDMIKILSRIKVILQDRAVFLHVRTTKGKGLSTAEKQADLYHGVGIDHSIGTGIFAQALGQTLNELIEEDNRIVAITAAMKDGTGLKAVEEKHPDNFIDVGIAEEYAVTLSAGMAKGGLKPIVAVYSTFMQRAYDQIMHDVCLPSLPVIFCLDRAGFVGADGKTHQGLFDLSYLSHIPNLSIFAPTSVAEFKDILKYSLSLNSPVAIRYPNQTIDCNRENLPIERSLWEQIKTGEKVEILAVGPRMLKIATEISDQADGIGIINARSIKPLDEKMLNQIQDKPIIVLEENAIIGGFGANVTSYYNQKGKYPKIAIFGAKDNFVQHGTIDWQLKENDICIEEIKKTINKLII